jgi:hypothetical protein
MVVDSRGGDVGMAEPFLHLGDVGLVIERVGGGGGAQRMRADQKPERPRITPHQAIDAVRGDRVLHSAGAVVADRPEQRAGSPASCLRRFGPRPLDAFDRVVGDGVLLTEIFEQRGQRSQPVPDRRAAEPTPAQRPGGYPFGQQYARTRARVLLHGDSFRNRGEDARRSAPQR